MKRIMIAGTHSGCGKTTITCAVLQALSNQGLSLASFKCGPDYIDPMFHSTVIGTQSRNLDGYFCDREMQRYLLMKNSANTDLALLEGVMGYYDGVGDCASSYQTAMDTQTPAVLVIDCKGMSRSIGAVLKGYTIFQQPSGIAGVIFNRLPESQIETVKQFCQESGVAYLGYFPVCREFQLESRHLGLVTAAELTDLRGKMQILAGIAKEHLLLDKLLEIAATARPFPCRRPEALRRTVDAYRQTAGQRDQIRIAAAMDRAFCFYYEDNLDLLRELGAEIVPFSPLRDAGLPEQVQGLLLAGGYPELYLYELQDNETMRKDLSDKVADGLPVIAECGGFMYLHRCIKACLENERKMEYNSKEKSAFQMAGIINAEAYRTGKLQRFGYIELKALKDTLLLEQGGHMRAHEFHYWDSTDCGEAYMAKKASNGLSYACVHASPSMYAGFPHIHFYSNPNTAVNFIKACTAYGMR